MSHQPLTREVQRHTRWLHVTRHSDPTNPTVRCSCGAFLGPYTNDTDAEELRLDHLDDVLTPTRPRVPRHP